MTAPVPHAVDLCDPDLSPADVSPEDEREEGLIETVVADEAWRDLIADPEAFAHRCHRAARRHDPRLSGAASLLLTDDAGLADLNRRFRDKDGPTNVLSFPSGDPAPGFLGDIALARETCAREAAEKGVSAQDHAGHLIVHGLLHLIGHDHETDAEAAAMESLESRIVIALGCRDPYGDDSPNAGAGR